MTCAINKVDSNVTGLAFAEETCLQQLPSGSGAIWRALEPNSYANFGGKVTTMSRAPIAANRQRKKGTITALDVSAGFNIDLTQSNLIRLLQGFFFADAHEKPATQPLNGTQVVVTGVTTGPNTFTAASGLGVFKVGGIVMGEGFTNPGNNSNFVLSAVAAGLLTTTGATTAEASPPATARLRQVGFQAAASDITMAASAGAISLGSTVLDFTTLGLTLGEWIFVGGDAVASAFATVPAGYARVSAISAHTLNFSDTTFTAATDAGTGKTIQLYFGTFIKNEDTPPLIKRRSYTLERSLGQDSVGSQAEYISGAIPDGITINVPLADKINADLTFVGMDNSFNDGTVGLAAGTRVASAGEPAYNTSSDVYRMKMSIVDPTSLDPAPLFGYLSDLKLQVANNVASTKAIGNLAAFDASAGDFEVSGSATAYFTTVEAVEAVRAYADVAINIISAQLNKGFVLDIPLLGMDGGDLNVVKDKPIDVALNITGNENAYSFTMAATFLPYLPTVGMPQ